MNLIRQFFGISKIQSKLISGGIWAFLGKFATSVMTLVINILLAHFLPPSELGVYFLAFNLSLLGAYMGLLGFEQTIIRFVAYNMANKMKANVVYVIRIAFVSTFIGAIITGSLYYFSSSWIANSIFESARLYSISLLLICWTITNIFQILLGETFRGFQDIRFASIFGGVLSTFLFVFGFFSNYYFAWMEINLNNVLVLSICSIVISNMLGMVFLIKMIFAIKREKGIGENRTIKAKELLSTTYPLMITSVSTYILSQSDLWMIGMVSSETDVAIYGNAAKLSMIIGMPVLIVTAFVTPMIAEKFAQGRLKELEKMLRFINTLATLPALVLVLLFALFGREILSLLFGSFYSGGALLLLLISMKQLLSVWNGACGTTLAMTGKQNYLMFVTLSTGVLSVVLAYVLGKYLGGVGIAIAYLLTGTLSQIFGWLKVQKDLNMRLDADFKNTFNQLKGFFKKTVLKNQSLFR